MKILLAVLILIFSLQSWTKADDIKEFEVEFISFLHQKHQNILDDLAAGKLNDTITNTLESVVKELTPKYA